MSSLTYGVEIDRLSGVFNFTINYTIDGYADPETPEYFGETSWTATYYPAGQSGGGGSSGFAAESETVFLELGLDPGPGLKAYVLNFSAMNTFSAVSVSGTWN